MALAHAYPRIGIVGAGIGGLALAAMLARQTPKGTKISVLERSHENRDEGYGLDLDEWGQTVLVKTGMWNRFWDVSRLKSDLWSIYSIKGENMLVPKWSSRMEAESNRAGMRHLFMEGIDKYSDTASVQYNHHITDIRRAASSETGAVELVAKDGSVVGEYDLVVDACGLHSPLRTHRVIDEVGTTSIARGFIKHDIFGIVYFLTVASRRQPAAVLDDFMI